MYVWIVSWVGLLLVYICARGVYIEYAYNTSRVLADSWRWCASKGKDDEWWLVTSDGQLHQDPESGAYVRLSAATHYRVYEVRDEAPPGCAARTRRPRC